MAYNMRIVRTKNYIEFWEYGKIIHSQNEIADVNDCVDETDNKNKTKRRTFDELSEEEQSERIQRMNRTRLEAKWRLLRIVDSNFDDKTSFLTLTTKENIQNRDEFNNLFKSFIKRFNYHVFNTKKRKLKYIAVLEKQKRGAWHAHILLFQVPYVPHALLLKLWGLGAVRINKLNHLDDSSNAGRYVVKYMEKGIGQELLESFGKKSYLSSRNLKKPQETKIYSEDKLEFDDSDVLYSTEYVSKVYRDGRLIDNPVRYRKIKLHEKDD